MDCFGHALPIFFFISAVQPPFEPGEDPFLADAASFGFLAEVINEQRTSHVTIVASLSTSSLLESESDAEDACIAAFLGGPECKPFRRDIVSSSVFPCGGAMLSLIEARSDLRIAALVFEGRSCS